MIPSLSLMDEKPVVVQDGEYEPYVYEGREQKLEGSLQKLGSYDRLYLLDLDGIEFNRPQTNALRKISTRKEVWADIGARDSKGITDAYIAGADRAVISTKTISSKECISNSIELSDELILSIEFKEEMISPSEEIRDMGMRGISEFCLEEGMDTIILVDLSDDRFEKKYLHRLPKGDYDLFVGGISKNEIDHLKHPNLSGFILGLEEAVKYNQN